MLVVERHSAGLLPPKLVLSHLLLLRSHRFNSVRMQNIKEFNLVEQHSQPLAEYKSF